MACPKCSGNTFPEDKKCFMCGNQLIKEPVSHRIFLIVMMIIAIVVFPLWISGSDGPGQ